MKPEDYIRKYLPICKDIETKTKIPALAILAQVALETGWMKYAPGFNFFGMKAIPGHPHQLLQTVEYSKKPRIQVYKIISSVYIEKTGLYRIVCLDYFRKFENETEAFTEYTKMLLNQRYLPSLRWHYSPLRYLIANWRAGYATDPKYAKKMAAMLNSIKRRL